MADHSLGRPTWVEIDLDAICHNARQLRALAGTPVLAVLKADAYGHGATLAARAALAGGATQLALATLEEAATLRQNGIAAPLLLLGYLPATQMRAAVALRLTVTVGDWQAAQALSEAAVAAGTTAAAHLAVDTGMSRLGLFPADVPAFLSRAASLSGLRFEGIYTHLATADGEWAAEEHRTQNVERRTQDGEHIEYFASQSHDNGFEAERSTLYALRSTLLGDAYAHLQLDRFDRLLAELEAVGLCPPLAHAANSAALLRLPRSCRYQLVRPGLALYGLPPFDPAHGPDQARRAALRALRPALAWRTHVVRVAELPPGTPVSYGAAYVTPGWRRIATLPVGYADGLRRSPPWRAVLVRGRRAPIVGRICMDYVMCDVTHIPGAAMGDEVTLLGAQGDGCISAGEVADWLGTSVYEVLTAIGGRVPRVAR